VLTNKIFRYCLVNITDDDGSQVWCLAFSTKPDVLVVKASEEGAVYLASILPVVSLTYPNILLISYTGPLVIMHILCPLSYFIYLHRHKI